jgi:flavoprotein hydroxylase
VRRTVVVSVQLGNIICITDAAAAERRDATLTAGRLPDRSLSLPLRDGLLRRTVGTVAAPPTGAVVPHGRVGRGDQYGLFDQMVGTGFVLLAATDPNAALGPAQRRLLTALDTHVVQLVPDACQARSGAETWTDLDEVYLPFLAAARAQFALVRPARHLFGLARNSRELTGLIDQLAQQLTLAEVSDPPRH